MANLQQTAGVSPGANEGVDTGAEVLRSGSRGLFASFRSWAKRVNLERKLALVLLVGAVTSGTVTLVAMTGNLPVALPLFCTTTI